MDECGESCLEEEQEDSRHWSQQGREGSVKGRSGWPESPPYQLNSTLAIEVGSLSLFDFCFDELKIPVGPNHIALLADPNGPRAALCRFFRSLTPDNDPTS